MKIEKLDIDFSARYVSSVAGIRLLVNDSYNVYVLYGLEHSFAQTPFAAELPYIYLTHPPKELQAIPLIHTQHKIGNTAVRLY